MNAGPPPLRVPTDVGAPGAVDPLGLRAARARTRRWSVGLVVALAVTLTVAVGAGPVAVPPASVLAVLGDRLGVTSLGGYPGAHEAIVWQVRLPRVLLAALVGAGLAVCGVALQAMVRNALADPYLLGINSGASCGAAAAILFGVLAGAGPYALSGSAFLGAVGASVLVLLAARSGGRVTSVRMLLAGVAVGYALSGLTSFLVFASGSAEGARSVMFWLLGSLGLARWDAMLAVVAVVVLLTVTVLTLWGRPLDALAAGDETAHTLGVPPDRFRLLLLALVSLCVAVVVAASGSIGFVGLVVPHLARRAVGAVHARVVPVAALSGAMLLVWADTAARTVLAPQEVPIGILTSVVGAPFLLVLIRRLHATSA